MNSNEKSISVNEPFSPRTCSATPFLDTLRKAKNMHSDADDLLAKTLRERGWEHTSATPGCIWQWVKKLPNGMTAMVNMDRAIDIEVELCGEHYEDLGG